MCDMRQISLQFAANQHLSTLKMKLKMVLIELNI